MVGPREELLDVLPVFLLFVGHGCKPIAVRFVLDVLSENQATMCGKAFAVVADGQRLVRSA